MSTSAEIAAEPISDRAWLLSLLSWSHLVRFGAVAFQFGLLVLLIRTFQIESRAFLYVSILTFCGFLVHHVLPLRFRMPFFGLLSVAAILLIFGLGSGTWLVGTGLLLIGIAHLPVAFGLRVVLLLVAGSGIAALRGGWLEGPWPSAIWPILGSMFMFRLIVYVYDLRTAAAPFSFWRALGYFFMLPNVCFPMFPVVDYKGFCRTHYRGETFEIYQTGVVWIFRGIVHLLLYRFVYQHLVIDPATIAGAAKAAQHVLATYLLYLKISGTFHVIVGMLHLFGFNLHETHHDYLLSSSFTDFWRRINIYWKDFIQKIFFNPLYFKLNRRVGPTAAMTVATFTCFAATWILHSYQWFWLRGDFPWRWQDATFWGLLAVLVLGNMLYENKYGRRRRLKGAKRTFTSEILMALRTVGIFVVISLSWTLWSAESLDELKLVMLEFTRMTPTDAAWIVAALLGLGALAILFGRTWKEQTDLGGPRRAKKGGESAVFWRSASAVAGLSCVILLVGTMPTLVSFAPSVAGAVAQLKSNDRLNLRDANALERGYYEDLTDVTRFNNELATLYADRPADWNINPGVQMIDGFPTYELIPSTRVPFKGATLTTNRWGMRDREYDKSKPADTYRIALLGASHSMGAGVNDAETYENLVEELLNRQGHGEAHRRYEILNFSVGGYGPLNRLSVLQDRVLSFQPDAFLYVGIDDAMWVVREASRHASLSTQLPHDRVFDVYEKADVEPGLAEIVAEQRLRPYATELVDWVYREIVELCQEHDVLPLATFVPRATRGPTQRALLDAQREAAEAAGFTVIDISDAYEEVEDTRELHIAKWDKHPNARGHRLLAHRLHSGLQPVLEEALDQSGG